MNSKKFRLDKETYKRTYWLIRSYPKLLAISDSKIETSLSSDGQPKGNTTGDPVFAALLRREQSEKDLSAIRRGLGRLPNEYKDGVFRNAVFGDRFPDYADIHTWKYYKRMFVYWTAKEAGYV